MFDSFEMACHDEETALRLNIKVNSENLLPVSQKYNLGSLRLPDDPSWPKIPQRKMIDGIGDPMQSSYVVAANGTPRRSRSLVRTPQPGVSASRDSENFSIYHCCQKDPNLVCQGPRRRPGCSDPRFKKVTTVKSHMTSTESVERDIDKQMESRRSAVVIPDQSKPVTSKTIPEKDTTNKKERSRVTQQRAEKPGELKGTESIGIQTIEAESGTIEESALGSSTKQSLDIGYRRNTVNSIENSREQCGLKTTRQVLVDNSSLYSRNNSMQSRTTNTKEQEKTLFSVTNNKGFTSAFEKVDKPQSRDQYVTKNWTSQPKNTVGSSQFFSNETPANATLTETRRNVTAYDEHHYTNLDTPMKSCQEKNREDNVLRMDNNETARRNAIKHDYHIHCHRENNVQNGPTAAQKLHDVHSYRYRPAATDSDGDGQERGKKPNFISTDEERMYTDWTLNAASRNLSSHVRSRSTSLRPKRKVRSGHRLLLNKKRAQSSEPRITNASKKPRDLHLKKTNSTFSKRVIPKNPYAWSLHEEHIGGNLEQNLYDTTTDFGTSYRPANDSGRIQRSTEVCDVKHDHSKKPYLRPLQRSAKVTSSLEFEVQNFQKFKSPRTETDASTVQPTSIPIKTQQLLNKSYWEYYNKMKMDKLENSESPRQQYSCEIAMGAPRSKKRRATELITEETKQTSQMEDQLELSLPEIRTLEQCSVLSTMINNTLETDTAQLSTDTACTKQLYLNGNMRSSSDPTAGTQSAVLKKLLSTEINETSPFSSTFEREHAHKRGYPFGNRALKIKSIGEHPIIFFGCMVYAMIVFIPMIYEYLFYEDEDEWEDLSYVEIAFDYMAVYCKDVLSEVFDTVNRIFFKPKITDLDDVPEMCRMKSKLY